MASTDSLGLDEMGWEWGDSHFRADDNPYLDEVMRFVEENHMTIEGGQMETDFGRPLDPNFPFSLSTIFGERNIRFKYSYAIPTDPVLAWMVGIGPIVEAGAGKGYWARMVSARGGDIVAYDHLNPAENPATDGGDPWFPIEIADCTVAAEHPDRILLLCWPPLGEDMATRAAKAHLDAGGRYIIYIGESSGGCTASDSFFDLMDTKLIDMTPTGLDVLSWWGIHDYLCFYRSIDGQSWVHPDAPPVTLRGQ